MALNTFKCNRLTPLRFKGLINDKKIIKLRYTVQTGIKVTYE